MRRCATNGPTPLSRDNWKRLLIAMAPDLVPFAVRRRGLERSWARYAERAADDRAVAGSAHRSVALAAALVRVARLGAAAPAPLAASLMGDAQGIWRPAWNACYEGPQQQPELARRDCHGCGQLASVVFIAAIGATYPVLLTTVHQLLEQFMD
jgi:hypothetical protein